MTKKEYDRFTHDLKDRGYSFYNGTNPYYSKVIVRRRDEDGNERAVCILTFTVYDFFNFVGYESFDLEPTVMISRGVQERVDLLLAHPKLKVKECERIAKEFLAFMDSKIPYSCER